MDNLEDMKEDLSSYYSADDVPPEYIVYCTGGILWGVGDTREEALKNAQEVEGEVYPEDQFLYERQEGWQYVCRGAVPDLD